MRKQIVPGDLIQIGVTREVVPLTGARRVDGDVVILEPSPVRELIAAAQRRVVWIGLLAVAFIGSIFLANYLTDNYGLVAAGFGLAVPAGTYAAGLALGLRDALQDLVGAWWVVGLVVAGAAATWAVSPVLAVASATAFLVSELVDLAVYTPLRKRGQGLAAIGLSNTVGAAVDTLIFLSLAGIPLTAENIGGQLLVKAVFVTAPFLAWKAVRRVPLVR
ncbi:VUT family protein [Amycolatopsis japonica]